MPKKLMLIAETDGEGHVVCVWRRGQAERVARPLLNRRVDLTEIRQAEIFGAAPEAVSQWVLQQGERGFLQN